LEVYTLAQAAELIDLTPYASILDDPNSKEEWPEAMIQSLLKALEKQLEVVVRDRTYLVTKVGFGMNRGKYAVTEIELRTPAAGRQRGAAPRSTIKIRR
jgi:hypothetical protein